MSNILICGGNGFIGGRLSSYLINFLGYKIFSLSRDKPKIKNKNVNYLYSNNFDYKSLNKLFKGMDVIIHLACMNSSDCEKNPEKSIIINTNITKNVVNASVNNRVKKLIYISTIHVYGKNLKGKVTENTETYPIHPYAISHKKSEDLIFHLKEDFLKTTIFRLSNAYGFPANFNTNCWSLVINDICKQAIERHLILLKSNGMQKRNFLQMRDVCKILEFTINSNDDRLENKIFNLGGKWTLSILEVANLVSKLISQKLKINDLKIKRNLKQEEFNEFLYDTNRLKELNFKTSCDDMAELNNLIDYCEKNFVYR